MDYYGSVPILHKIYDKYFMYLSLLSKLGMKNIPQPPLEALNNPDFGVIIIYI